jgi:DNA-binding beta-propeller fold protein YncE
MSADTFIADDSDGDGVADSVDACPAEDASYFDRDGDGCIDALAGARHTEYWGVADTVVTYVINASGATGIGDGSDFTAIQNAVDAWPAIPNTDLTVTYSGTVAMEDAVAGDQINLVTFVDDQYSFGSAVLAVGITTSFTVDSLHNARLYRPGEIVDADMIFNPVKIFTTSGGPGTDIQSTAAHEAGHLFGISHSAVKSATMHYVLPGGTAARTLESDDELVFLKAYPDPTVIGTANQISGTVTDGGTANPVPGAIVFAIDSATGDTTASDYTLPDGSYTFIGMPDGGYYISIYPFNNTSPINYLKPEYVNALVETTAVTLFVPEYWDVAESATDNAADMDVINVAGGSSQIADLITNIDVTAPTVTSISPTNGEIDVRIDAAMLIQFSEPIDAGTISGNFRLRAQTGPNAGSLIGGNAVVLNDDSVVAFTPSTPYTFEVIYQLTLNTDSTAIADKYGNPMAALFVSAFTTELEPPLSISSLAPNKGVVGNTIVINGAGFDPIPDANLVSFNGTNASISAASPNRLVVTVPTGTTTGPVTVSSGGELSNQLTFTLLSDVEIARGFEVGVSSLAGIPNAVVVTPSGSYAYVATDVGASAVIVNEGLAGYLTNTSISIPGGLDDLDVTPDGQRVYGVSRATNEVHVIDSTPGSGTFNTLLNSVPTGADPLGITVDPTSRRAFVATPDSLIQVWDVNLQSETYERQVGVIEIPDANLRGNMAVTPAGDMLLALSGLGDMYVFDLGPDTLLATIAVGPDPHDVVVDPVGQRAYVSDLTGLVSIVSLDLMTFVQDISASGSVWGLTITPAGTWIYAADEQLNQLDVIDLHEENATFRSVAATIPQAADPVDVDVSPDGLYAYSVVRSNKQLVATAIGLGPYLTSLSKRTGNPGHKVVVSGGGFDLLGTTIDFNGIEVDPDYITGSSVVVTVPSGATSGPVRAVVVPSDVIGVPTQYSNAIYFQILGQTPPGNIRLAAKTAPLNHPYIEPTLAISPLGDLMLIGGVNGEVFFLDIDPASPSFNQSVGAVAPFSCCVYDIAFSPDGKLAFCASTEEPQVAVINVDQNSNDYQKLVGEVDIDPLSWTCPEVVKIAPSGEFGIIWYACSDNLVVFDLVEESPRYLAVTDSIPIPSVVDFEISPDGLFAVVMQTGTPGIWSLILDPFHANYLNLTSNMPFTAVPPPLPVSAAFYPDGDSVMVWAADLFTPNRYLYRYDTRVIDNYSAMSPISGFGGPSSLVSEMLRLSPRGDRLIMHVTDNAIEYHDITTDPFTEIGFWYGAEVMAYLDAGFTPDASRYYTAAQYGDSLLIFDFSTAQMIWIASGQYQVGVVDQPLAAPLRVRVGTTTGQSLAGVPITFQVVSGGGYFTAGESNVQNVVVATDNDGYAEVDFTLGPSPGTQNVQVVASGLSGSPLLFISTAVEDPATLPLQFSQMLPVVNAGDVSVSTAVQVTFSRGVDTATIADSTLYLHKGDLTPVPAVYGFTTGDSKVSLTPVSTLDYSTTYTVEVTGSIHDKDGGTLVNPASPLFVTESQPPPTLSSIAPPAGTVLAPLVLSGNGFDPVFTNNTVLFNGATAAPTAGRVDFLNVKVPLSASSGLVRVATASDTSNAQPFNVLVPSTSSIDDVIASASTGNNSKTITMSPDGSVAYSVSPDGDIVIPIGVDPLATFPSIPVGDNPVAIVMHPLGTFAYVANFGSASVSVLDTDEGTPPTSVASTMVVGPNPVDLAVMPDGSRVIVANGGVNSITVIDGDSSSATHNTVIASVSTGKNSTTITVSPDGTRIYVGTEDSIEILESVGYSVIASVSTGKNTTTITVSPDGTLLFAVTSEGDVLIVDVEPGSSTENSVIASVSTGKNTTTVTVSPDGSLLYLVQENSDEVIVINVETIGSVAALEQPVVLPPKSVHVTFLDTIPTGDNPEDLVFDPTGSGKFLIVTSGDQMVTLYGETSKEFVADIRVTPRTLNLQSRGRFVEGLIELAPPATVGAADIDVSTVLLQDTIPVVPGSAELYDEDEDGIDDLVVKFDRVAFQTIMPLGEFVPVKISGEAGIHTFTGWDTIRTIRPTVTHPVGGEIFAVNAVEDVTWTSPAGAQVDYVDVHFSLNDGASWLPIAEAIPDDGMVAWAIPLVTSEECRVMVTLYRGEEPIGLGMSSGTFTIAMPVAVKLTNFEAAVEDGAAVMRWTTGVEAGTEGFHLVRSEVEDGLYQRMTDDMIAANGGADGARYEYRDDTVRPNRRYYYKLQEVATNGLGVEYGPYELVYKLTFGLEQNTPNPFNPTTTIRFSIARDSPVRLVVYDVGGRRVRTLIDGNRRADIYKEVWDGTNDAGQQVATGVYFYRLTAGKFVQTKKMLLLK